MGLPSHVHSQGSQSAQLDYMAETVPQAEQTLKHKFHLSSAQQTLATLIAIFPILKWVSPKS